MNQQNTTIQALLNTFDRLGPLLLALQKKGLEIEKKGDGSPVTNADFLSHQMITETLTQVNPSIPIISEEGVIPDYEERKTYQQFWLLDPIDGTRAFINGNPDFAVSLAFIQDQTPVLGLIFLPEEQCSYYAIEGHCYKKVGNDDAVMVQRTLSDEEGPVIVANFSYEKEALSQFVQELEDQLGRSPHCHSVSSAKKFCMIAEGKADIYPKFNPIMEWDIAAGHCLLEAVGLEMLNLNTKTPLRYNTEHLTINGFLAGQIRDWL